MDFKFSPLGARKKLLDTTIEVYEANENESSKPKTLDNESILLKISNDGDEY